MVISYIATFAILDGERGLTGKTFHSSKVAVTEDYGTPADLERMIDNTVESMISDMDAKLADTVYNDSRYSTVLMSVSHQLH